ncbi:hypothetical protein U1Q18_046727 [Sarracenia purpurea var. burkii]
MECNRDEANRAREIAEKKFTEKDIMGAKKFAIKAQSLYPRLEGIQQMLATLDVYISSENRINGDADWYGILGVNPRADEETVRRHYRKLALMLHPDKNKSIGAEGAFKLISEAWSLLSDKAKRLAYDQKRNIKVLQQKVPPASRHTSAPPPGSNGFYNFAKSTTPTTPHLKVQKGNTTKAGTSGGPAPSQKQKPTTFWTLCHRCKMQYEYVRMYLNHNLLCPNCHEPFFAIETPPPLSHGSKAQRREFQQRHKDHKEAGKNVSTAGRNNTAIPNVGPARFSSTDSVNHTNFQWGPFSGTAGASSAAQAANVVKQAYEKVKREREEVQAATKREEALQRKNHASKKTGGISSSGYSNSMKRKKGMDGVNQMGPRIGGAGTTAFSGPKQGIYVPVRTSGSSKPKDSWDLSDFEIQNLLMEKAKTDIRKKVNEWNSAILVKSAVKSKESVDEKARENIKVKDIAMMNGARQDQYENDEPINMMNERRANMSIPGSSGGNLDKGLLESMSINVPDPDFHDFDKDRTERCFGENQVWAAYDDYDGMPRYYALIRNVISLNPFKMRISWLNSKTNGELGSLNWVGFGFPKTCGDFRIGKHEVNNLLNSFSHKVRWTKGARGAVCIFPRKGDVWALYRNWSPEWNELTEDEIIHKYDMVEVLEDYDEEFGVTVTPLVKVAGFKTVFHGHLDPREVRTISREEIFRFSHRVPSYLLTGQEDPNAPKGCHELDPAAMPLELLQVIPDAKDEDIVENEEKHEVQKVVDGVGKSNNRKMDEKFSNFGLEVLGKSREEEETLENGRGRKEANLVNSTEEKTVS